MWKPWNSCCVGLHKCYIKCLVSVHVCLRTGKGHVMPLKNITLFFPVFLIDSLSGYGFASSFLLRAHTHTHTTGSQVFSGSSPPQPLPYPSVSLSTQVREADWQGCGVYQWCDVFEHCLPLGDETLRWGSGVFVWERKRQREAFAPKRIQCTRMLQKTSESMGGIHRAPSVGVSLQRQFWFHDVMVEFHLVQSNNISPANKTSLLKPQDLIWSSPNN